MTPSIQIFTDEDVYGAVARALRNAGYDALSTAEANRLGESDESQLDFAAAENRALVTFNVGHFARLHSERMIAGKTHTGVIVSAQRPVSEIVRRLLNLAANLDADEMRDRLEFLTSW